MVDELPVLLGERSANVYRLGVKIQEKVELRMDIKYP